uniref:SSD domain-containing protein n=1 Tax=Thermosporothrix sp. COM3 TaxID=2490863 RepID=A0A455SL82_9CHLR|nr:hypothetical protein KTC_24230 [Thermosporothrix sp. COM3]
MWNPLHWLTDASAGRRGRWIVIVLWLVLAGVLGGLAPKLANLYDSSITSSIGDQESVRAQELLKQAFPGQRGIPALIVFHDPARLSQDDYNTTKKVNDWFVSGDRPKQVKSVVSIYTVPQAKSQLVSPDETTMNMIVLLDNESGVKVSELIKQIRSYTGQFDRDSLKVKVTGPAGIAGDMSIVFGHADFALTIATIGIVLLFLIVIYRSPLLVLLPLIGVGIAQVVVNGLLGFGVQAHLFSISQDATSIVTVLLFGAGTDYTIFIVSRYREELQLEADHVRALQKTLRAVGEAILSSAGTVIVAVLTLLLTLLGLYHVLGAALAIALFVMALVGLTLVPALLSLFGRAAFWPFRASVQVGANTKKARPGLWERVASLVTRRPALSALCSAFLLVILALGNLGIPQVFNTLTGFRSATDSNEGYKLLSSHFPPGTLAPFSVLIHFKDQQNAYEHLDAIDAITEAITQVDNVAQVTGPTRPDGKKPAMTPAQIQQSIAQLPQELRQALRSGDSETIRKAMRTTDPRSIGLYGATISSISNDNRVVRLQVTLKSDPYSDKALDTVSPVRDAAKVAAARNGIQELVDSIMLTGVTPQQADTRTVNTHDQLLIIPLVLVLIALVLGLLLRSIVAPLYLLATVTLNYLAALGISAFIFTRIGGDEGISYALPLYTFIFLVALGADYTIFLMSRVREESSIHGLAKGLPIALSHTGGVITSAGLILASTFLVLSSMPVRELYQLGITVAIGILLDTFVVRGFLVPGIVLLLRGANWWPGKLPQPKEANEQHD